MDLGGVAVQYFGRMGKDGRMQHGQTRVIFIASAPPTSGDNDTSCIKLLKVYGLRIFEESLQKLL